MKKQYRLKADICRGLKTHHVVEAPQRVPAHVAIERERRQRLSHGDITAELLGDPLPGYSALDRKTITA